MTPRRFVWGDDPRPLVECVARGGVLALPTESSYALAVDPGSRSGCELVFEVKGRPADRALPVVAADLDQVLALGVAKETPGLDIVAPFWPAALSVVVPLRVALPAAADDGTIAVRVPAHERLRRLLSAIGTALTATSANRSGEPPILEPDPLLRLLRDVDGIVVDDGRLPGGAPSTLLRWSEDGFDVLRAGRWPIERLGALGGQPTK